MKGGKNWMYSVGAAFVLSLPWLFLLPGWILFVGFVPLFLLEERLRMQNNPERSRFVFLNHLLLCFGLWNFLSAWWLAYATVVGFLLFLLVNTLLMSSVWFLYYRFKEQTNNSLSFLFLVALWLSFEYLHLNWDMQLPGMILGGAFGNQPEIVQWYEYTGVLGGSMWVFIGNWSIFHAFRVWRLTRKISIKCGVTVFVVFLVPIVWSGQRYLFYSERGEDFPVVLLQPSIDPYSEKFSGLSEADQLNRILNLIDSMSLAERTFVIGPETAIAPFWEDSVGSNLAVSELKRRVIDLNLSGILIGANTRKLVDETVTKASVRKLGNNRFYEEYNASVLILSDTVLFYHKNILVSGVEKVPFADSFMFLKRFYIDLGGTSGGLGEGDPGIFRGDQFLPVSPLVCFESMFGEFLSRQIQLGGQWIALITNDGWWKTSSGAPLHFSYARLRAVEMRRSVARSANTGISGIINQRGDVLLSTKQGARIGVQGAIKGNNELTFYARYGDFVGRVAAFVSVLLLLMFWSRNLSRKISFRDQN